MFRLPVDLFSVAAPVSFRTGLGPRLAILAAALLLPVAAAPPASAAQPFEPCDLAKAQAAGRTILVDVYEP